MNINNIRAIFKALFPSIEQRKLPEEAQVCLSEVSALQVESGFSFWFNKISVKQDTTYNVVLPAGLHLSFSLGGMMETSTAKGHAGDMSGFMQNLLYLAQDEVMTTTIIRQEDFLACGISLSQNFLRQNGMVAKKAKSLIENMNKPFHVTWLQPEIQRVIECCYYARNDGLDQQLVAQGILMQILGYWRLEPSESQITLNNARQVFSVKQQIEQCEDHWLTSSQLAAQIGLSEQVLNKAFKQHFQMSISQFIRRRKLQLAHKRLFDGIPITHIADSLDMSPQYFSEWFKSYYGDSPKQFQVKSRKKTQKN